MDTAQIIFQLLTAIVTVLAILQKEKWKMMFYYTLNNLACVAMYFAFARTTTAIICIVAAVRTIIFMFYSLKKIKPNYVWLIIFELAFVATTIITWQDALDLLPLVAMVSACYGSWQDNHFVLRVSYIVNNTTYVVYQLIIGAYISMAISLINLACTIICFVYYCLLKKEKPILQVIFKNKKNQNIDKN